MKWQLMAAVTVSAFTIVEADSLEEAIEIAEGREVAIGGLHSGVDPEDTWSIDEPDGSPENIHQV